MIKYYCAYVKHGTPLHLDLYRYYPACNVNEDLPALIYFIEDGEILKLYTHEWPPNHRYTLRKSNHINYQSLKEEMDDNENYVLKEITEQEVFVILL